MSMGDQSEGTLLQSVCKGSRRIVITWCEDDVSAGRDDCVCRKVLCGDEAVASNDDPGLVGVEDEREPAKEHSPRDSAVLIKSWGEHQRRKWALETREACLRGHIRRGCLALRCGGRVGEGAWG